MALDSGFAEFLEDEFGRMLPEPQERTREAFAALGFGERNAAFVEFWSTFSEEMYGTIGYTSDVSLDVLSFDGSRTATLRQHDGLAENYYEFFNPELDDFLFYDRATDEVLLVEAGDYGDFLENRSAAQTWPTFVAFIKEFLEFDEG